MPFREKKDRGNSYVIGGEINLDDSGDLIKQHAIDECSGNEQVGAILVQIVAKSTHRDPRWLAYTAMGTETNQKGFKASPLGAATPNDKVVQDMQTIIAVHTNPWHFYLPGLGWIWVC